MNILGNTELESKKLFLLCCLFVNPFVCLFIRPWGVIVYEVCEVKQSEQFL